MNDQISKNAVISMLKHAINVFENDTSIRQQRLRGIAKTNTGYRIHSLFMSQFFNSDDAKQVCGGTFDYEDRSYLIFYDEVSCWFTICENVGDNK